MKAAILTLTEVRPKARTMLELSRVENITMLLFLLQLSTKDIHVGEKCRCSRESFIAHAHRAHSTENGYYTTKTIIIFRILLHACKTRANYSMFTFFSILLPFPISYPEPAFPVSKFYKENKIFNMRSTGLFYFGCLCILS